MDQTLKIINTPANKKVSVQRQVVHGDVEANPIIEAIYKKLQMSKQNKLSPDHFLCMLPNLIYSVTD